MKLFPGDPAPLFVRQPVFGVPVDAFALTRLHPVVLVFLRSPGSASAHRTVDALSAAWRELDLAGVAVVVVIRGEAPAVWDLVPRKKLLFPVIHDPRGSLYAAYRVEQDVLLWRSLVDPLGAGRALLGRGLPGQPFTQRNAAFVIGGGGLLAYCWYGKSVFDAPNVSGLITAATRAVVVGTRTFAAAREL
jgi:peroxiredoxin